MNIAVEFYKRHGKIPSRYLVHEFRDNSVLRTIMKLPPQEQLKSLQKRGKNLVLTNKWNELTSDSHDKAFTVAKVMSADLLQDIYNHVEQAKRDGWTLDEFRKNLLPKLESAGWVGANPSRLKVIYETNMQVAYAKERYKQHKLVSDEYPYWRYEQVERETKNHDHSKYHNKIFRHDDPIWSSIYPPSEYGCKCTVTPMSEDDVQGMTISKGTDFKDIEPPNLDLLKAWEPKTDKYVSGIKNQLESMLNKAEPVVEDLNIYDELPTLRYCTKDVFDSSWAKDDPKMKDNVYEFLGNKYMHRKDFLRLFAGGLYNSMTSIRIYKTPTGYDLTIYNSEVTIERKFKPNSKTVSHAYYRIIDEDNQGSGNTKTVFLSQLALYKSLGYERIEVHANIKVGCWSWGRYGFKYERDLHKLNFKSAFPGIKSSFIDKWFVKDKYFIDCIAVMSKKTGMSFDEIKDGLIKNKVDWYGYFEINNTEAVARAVEYSKKL